MHLHDRAGTLASTHIYTVYIADFVCEVLICADYARCYRLAVIYSVHVNYTDFHLTRLVPDIAYMTVQTVYSTAYRCLFTSASKEWTSISASLPDPKGPFSDYLPTASPERHHRIAEAKKRF